MSKNKVAARTQRVCYLAFACQALVINLAPVFFLTLQRSYGISFEKLGRLVLVSFITQLTMDLSTHPLVKRLGYRAMMIVAHLSCSLGLIFFALAPRIFAGTPYVGFMLAAIVYSVGAGFLEVLVNPIVDNLPKEANGTVMTLVHSFYSWGHLTVVLISTLLLLLLGNEVWPWLMCAWAILPLFNAYQFAFRPLILPEFKAPPKGQQSFLTKPLFWVMILGMIAAGASEQIMTQWASSFAEKGLGLSKFWGDLAGPCTFALMMAIVRMLYGKLGARFPMRLALIISPLLGLAAYLLAAFTGIAWLSLISCGLVGAAVALLWPGTLSVITDHYPGSGSLLFALVAVGGDIGGSLGPWAAGWITDRVILRMGALSDALGLRLSMLTGAAFCTLYLITSLLSQCVKSKNS